MCLPVPLTVRDMLLATNSQGHAARHPGPQSVTCCAKCQMHNVSASATNSQGHAAHCTTWADSQGHAVGNVRCAMCQPVPQTVRDMLCTTNSQGHAECHPGRQ
eukprot:1214888-Rhodomonas_salina.1